MDKLTSAEVYMKVVELGSNAAAASELKLSPSMVAKHLAAIERRLKVRLFRRTTRRLSLTEAGEMYYAHCKRWVEQFQEGEAAVSALQDHPTGTLRLFSQVTFGAHKLAPLLSAFLVQCPEVRVEVTLNDRAIDLIEGGFDAAIVIGSLKDSRYVVRPLRPYVVALAASPSYLERFGLPQTPEDLRHHNCLMFSHWDRRDTWHLLGPSGEFFIPVSGNLQIDNGQALLQAALAGTGVVMQPEVLLEDALASGDLVRILPDFAPPARPKSLVYLAGRYIPPKVSSFVAFFLAREGLPH